MPNAGSYEWGIMRRVLRSFSLALVLVILGGALAVFGEKFIPGLSSFSMRSQETDTQVVQAVKRTE
jgi:hypothetical protein